MKKLILLLITLPILGIGCLFTDENNAKRILESDGYSDIEFTGYDWFSCSGDDFYHTGFKATKNEKKVSGVVCAGLFFKGSTIRIH